MNEIHKKDAARRREGRRRRRSREQLYKLKPWVMCPAVAYALFVVCILAASLAGVLDPTWVVVALVLGLVVCVFVPCCLFRLWFICRSPEARIRESVAGKRSGRHPALLATSASSKERGGMRSGSDSDSDSSSDPDSGSTLASRSGSGDRYGIESSEYVSDV
ncbi:uncharacterized protein AMSG_01456 [Thecamonas trahens ATCC 50062]|uniref:Uncharacterized protein n=1 Tax=Thecamonas trahens ATCC 50062 TaxID=461836 RepID=A0A0L0DRI2_THETB|nr:hypothetical protein AMSG_01456 [Thecamonas trahens ATCC 50062]KNC54601.1 hypothetical protein AMSG_01456 [Thecamonas trahens ATCC 50062]|eukprot:XP_013761510.1 hypothetical protein AMSG_01456 [Thecamonas trahens ATCC 50062]